MTRVIATVSAVAFFLLVVAAICFPFAMELINADPV